MELCVVCRQPADYKCLRCTECVCESDRLPEDHDCGEEPEEDDNA